MAGVGVGLEIHVQVFAQSEVEETVERIGAALSSQSGDVPTHEFLVLLGRGLFDDHGVPRDDERSSLGAREIGAQTPAHRDVSKRPRTLGLRQGERLTPDRILVKQEGVR